MADNVTVDNGAGTDYSVATDVVTYSGDANQQLQLFRPVHVTGAEGSKTVTDITDANGLWVGGSVAHDAVDSGNPVKVGGRARTSSPAVAVGDRVDAWFTPDGTLAVAAAFAAAGADAVSNNSTMQLGTVSGSNGPLQTALMGYNGTTWDRARSLNAYDTAAASPNLGTLAAGQPDRRHTSVSLGTVVGNTQAWDCNGADVAMFHVGTTTTGSFLFEVSADGTNYVSAEARDVVLDTWVSATNITPAANKVYRVVTNGWRSVRVRTIATLGATVAFTCTLGARSTVISSIDTGPAPHAMGYDRIGVSAQYTTTQTSTTIGPTVASTQRLVVTALQIHNGGTTAGNVQVYFGTGAFSRGTSKPLYDGGFGTTAHQGVVFAPPNGWIGAADEEVKITTSAALNPLTVTIWYYLIPA